MDKMNVGFRVNASSDRCTEHGDSRIFVDRSDAEEIAKHMNITEQQVSQYNDYGRYVIEEVEVPARAWIQDMEQTGKVWVW
jgi:deoxyadenosine/deoxycytidine kinase